MKKTIVLLTGLLGALPAMTPDALASCGSANCFLVTGTQEGAAAADQIIIDLSYRFIPMDQPQHGSDSVAEAVTPAIDFAGGVIEPDHHREVRTNNELIQMDLSYGLNERWTLAANLPLVNNRRHEHYHLTPTSETFLQEDFTGLGDMRFSARYTAVRETKHGLIVGAGIKAPTGEYKLLNSDGDINEPTIMPGTGSWDGVLSGHYQYHIRPHRISSFVSGSYQITTENSLNYQFGNTLILNTGLVYTVHTDKRAISTSLQLNGRYAPRDEFHGEEVPSTGGTWIYLTPGAQIQLSDTTAIYTHVQVPVYQYVNDSNLVPRYGFILGASFNV